MVIPFIFFNFYNTLLIYEYDLFLVSKEEKGKAWLSKNKGVKVRARKGRRSGIRGNRREESGVKREARDMCRKSKREKGKCTFIGSKKTRDTMYGEETGMERKVWNVSGRKMCDVRKGEERRERNCVEVTGIEVRHEIQWESETGSRAHRMGDKMQKKP